MTRDQLIDAGAQAIADLGWVTEWGALDAFLDAVEPLIRAEERVKADAPGWRVQALQARQECAELRRERADLRAQVGALEVNIVGDTVPVVVLSEVLDLIDGGHR